MIPAPWMQGSALEPLVLWLLTVCVFGIFSMRSMDTFDSAEKPPVLENGAGETFHRCS